MLLAQSLGEYGILEGLNQGMMRLHSLVGPWMDEWGFIALVVGGVVVGGWAMQKLLGR